VGRPTSATCQARERRYHLPDGLNAINPFPPSPSGACIFEHVYFARPQLRFSPQRKRVRTELGRVLALEKPDWATGWEPVPDSGVCSGTWGSTSLLASPADGLIPITTWAGRSFTTPSIRQSGAGQADTGPKASSTQARQSVYDSIGPGTTSRKSSDGARRGGEGGVHVRISCPRQLPMLHGATPGASRS